MPEEKNRTQIIDDLVAQALELQPADRHQFVAERCADDAKLLAEVEELLRASDQGSRYFGELTDRTGLPGGRVLPDDEWHEGVELGPYTLVERLGAGGMGDVWLARQSKPIQRDVAIKILQAGLGSRDVLQRFQAEQQALALMDHPNVARVYDSGTFGENRPYFVMEYVRGTPITDYCDSNSLTLSERIELFEKVCAGVRHAHQRGIIHRDLKPGNILVSTQDDAPEPKIIDFGIAKAISQGLTEGAQDTRIGTLIGTLDYMAPEQTGLGADGVDTRTDVYLLGVVFYQLLVGELPIQATRGGGGTDLSTMLKAICEDVPVRPSRRIRDVGERQTEIVQARGASAASLSRQLRGELDWISMKALEKERDRRFDSAAAFAADLRLYRSNQPVSAGPPTARYQLAKFVKRHQIATGFSIAAVSALVAFAALMSVQSEQLARERDTSEQISGFLVDMMGSISPEESGSALWVDLESRVTEALSARNFSADDIAATLAGFSNALDGVSPTDTARAFLDRQILHRAGETIDAELSSEPAIAATLYLTLSQTYERLGMFTQSVEYATRSATLRERELGPLDPDVLIARRQVARAQRLLHEFDEGIIIARETYHSMRTVLGEDHPETLIAARELASLQLLTGKYAEAQELGQSTLEEQRRVLGPNHRDSLRTQNMLAGVTMYQGDLENAKLLYGDVLDRFVKTYGKRDEEAIDARSNYGLVHWHTGELEVAAEHYAWSLAASREVYGYFHHKTTRLMSGLAVLYENQGKFPEALELNREGLQILRRMRGPSHAETLIAMHNLATVHSSLEQFEDAESLFLQSIAIQKRTLPEKHPYIGKGMFELARLELRRGNVELAMRRVIEAVDAGYTNPDDELGGAEFRDPLGAQPEYEAALEAANRNAEKDWGVLL